MSSPAASATRSPAVSLPDDVGREGPSRRRVPGSHPPAPRGATGHYRYDLRRGTWSWSPEVFEVQGLPAGAADASTELLLQHLHPEDRTATLAALTGACAEGRPFTLRARIVRADGEQRAVILVGEPDHGPDGGAVDGLLIDLTGCPGPPEPPDRAVALEAEVAQLRAAMASRATIEQAKGILMLLTSCSDTVAFDLLAHISSHTHRKVRDVAESITRSASGHAPLPGDVRAIIRDACPPPRQRR